MIFTVRFGKNVFPKNAEINCTRRRLNKPIANPESNDFNNPFMAKRMHKICVATFIEKATIGLIALIQSLIIVNSL